MPASSPDNAKSAASTPSFVQVPASPQAMQKRPGANRFRSNIGASSSITSSTSVSGGASSVSSSMLPSSTYGSTSANVAPLAAPGHHSSFFASGGRKLPVKRPNLASHDPTSEIITSAAPAFSASPVFSAPFTGSSNSSTLPSSSLSASSAAPSLGGSQFSSVLKRLRQSNAPGSEAAPISNSSSALDGFSDKYSYQNSSVDINGGERPASISRPKVPARSLYDRLTSTKTIQRGPAMAQSPFSSSNGSGGDIQVPASPVKSQGNAKITGFLSQSRKVEITKTQSIRDKFSANRAQQQLQQQQLERRQLLLDDDDDDENEGRIITSTGKSFALSDDSSRDSTPSSNTGSAGPSRGRLIKGSNVSASSSTSSITATFPQIDLLTSDSENENDYDSDEEMEFDRRLLEFFNTATNKDIADIASCSIEIADEIIEKRRFGTLDAVRKVDYRTPEELEQEAASTNKRRRSARKSAGEKVVDACSTMLRGYEAVDSLIQKCENLGNDVSKSIAEWGVSVLGANGELEIADVDHSKIEESAMKAEMSDDNDDNDDGDEDGLQIKGVRRKNTYFEEKPSLLAPSLELKSYQQVGINWLNLLYNKGLSCILADEMGLGKTCQVISFLAHLKQMGKRGPHLVVVPSSTLENWLREFKKFCPSFVVEPYYGSMNERAEIREALSQPDANFDVIVTTYNLACGSKNDTGFLKSLRFNCCVYDEGHMLKNSESERYAKLMKLKANFRLLLTGTPLQNNLKELISLLAFILPNLFLECKDDLGAIFKHKAKTTDENTHNPLLSEQRITKAKTMMTPFILRRKKDQVLQHLPAKSHKVVYCELSPEQRIIYEKELEASRRTIEAREQGIKLSAKEKNSSSNVLMTLRKAALHHLLFRTGYDELKLKKMAHKIMQEDVYQNANEDYIYEDMEVMNDFELNRLCEQFEDSIGDYQLDESELMKSGKVDKLCEILPGMKKVGDRVLIFSQFTQVLDILERVLSTLDISFLRLDGSTPVEVRQDMIDKYYENPEITVFLLSTKAGGFGINLACANKVIIYDLSFNPHDDKQAEDRAHRVGQTREVEVIRMITRDTIEENILALANTKLALDRNISGEGDEAKAEEANASLVAKMLMKK